MVGAASREVILLLPVWGDAHVEQFLRFCLPSLLSPGNIPAVSARHRCKLQLLTRAADEVRLSRDPAWRRLKKICQVEVVAIDDLVSRSTATTLTLAYVRAMRATGDRLDQSVFVYLVGDYVFADGAIDSAIAQIEAGASAVQTGNFHVERDGMAAALEPYRSKKTGVLSLPADRLMQLGFENLHAATLVSTVEDSSGNPPPYHDPRPNRLFWRVGPNVMLGRYYLLHMFAISPEVKEFSISAPSDYAFVPALCPSGTLATIEDSRRFALVEMRLDNDLGPVRFGPPEAERLSGSIGEWASEHHRANLRNHFRFCWGEIDEVAVDEARARSDRFVDAIAQTLPEQPPHHVDHPYWRRMIERFYATAPAPLSRSELAELLGTPEIAADEPRGMEKWRLRLLGRMPDFRPWHPLWPDWRSISSLLAGICRGRKVMIGATSSAILRDALANTITAGGAARIASAQDGRQGEDEGGYELLVAEWPHCFSHDFMESVFPRLAPGAAIVIFVCDFADEYDNSYVAEQLIDIQTHLHSEDGRIMGKLMQASCVPVTDMRRAVQTKMLMAARSSATSGWFAMLRRAPALCLLMLTSAIQNRLALRQLASDHARSSSLALVFRLEKEPAAERTGFDAEGDEIRPPRAARSSRAAATARKTGVGHAA